VYCHVVVAGSRKEIPAYDGSVSARARLYLADLRRLSVPDALLGRALIPAERERATRFRRAEDRRRYLLGRCLTRGLLAEALGVAPNEVRLRFGEQGKPFVSDGPAFNLSHSGDFVLAGIADGGRFGLDVEQHNDRADVDALMSHCFSDWEIGRVRGLEPAERKAAFFRIWARKEALLKALGGGLSIGLKRISIDHEPDGGNVLHELVMEGENVHEWTVLPVEIAAQAAAAVAWDCGAFEFQMTLVCDADLENVIRALAT
jgi:4'-phosphopantetheinyl transferase